MAKFVLVRVRKVESNFFLLEGKPMLLDASSVEEVCESTEISPEGQRVGGTLVREEAPGRYTPLANSERYSFVYDAFPKHHYVIFEATAEEEQLLAEPDLRATLNARGFTESTGADKAGEWSKSIDGGYKLVVQEFDFCRTVGLTHESLGGYLRPFADSYRVHEVRELDAALLAISETMPAYESCLKALREQASFQKKYAGEKS